MDRQKILRKCIPWAMSIATSLMVFSFSWHTVTSTENGVTTTTASHTLDLALGIATLLACISLISTFKTSIPKVAYWGLYAYAWFLGLCFAYIQSTNARVMWYFIMLPLQETLLPGISFSLAISFFLLVFRRPIMSFLNYIMKYQEKDSSANNSEAFQKRGDTRDSIYQDDYTYPKAVYPQEMQQKD